jgi:hypothetical protein
LVAIGVSIWPYLLAARLDRECPEADSLYPEFDFGSGLDRLYCTVYRRGRENVFNGLPNCFNCSWTSAARHSDLCRSQKWDKGLGERHSRHRIARHLRGLPNDRNPQLRVLTKFRGRLVIGHGRVRCHTRPASKPSQKAEISTKSAYAAPRLQATT